MRQKFNLNHADSFLCFASSFIRQLIYSGRKQETHCRLAAAWLAEPIGSVLRPVCLQVCVDIPVHCELAALAAANLSLQSLLELTQTCGFSSFFMQLPLNLPNDLVCFLLAKAVKIVRLRFLADRVALATRNGCN